MEEELSGLTGRLQRVKPARQQGEDSEVHIRADWLTTKENITSTKGVKRRLSARRVRQPEATARKGFESSKRSRLKKDEKPHRNRDTGNNTIKADAT